MSLAALLWMVTVSEAAAPSLPDPPEPIAQVTAQPAEGQPYDVILTTHQSFSGRRLADEAAAHQDSTTTGLTPSLESGEGTVHWLVGYWLSQRDQPGDTRVTASLLLQVPAQGHGEVRALWYQDHQEIPRSFWLGTGTLQPGEDAGAARLELELTDAEFGDTLKVEGLLRLPQ